MRHGARVMWVNWQEARAREKGHEAKPRIMRRKGSSKSKRQGAKAHKAREQGKKKAKKGEMVQFKGKGPRKQGKEAGGKG